MENEKKVEAEEEVVKGGELLFCGTTSWDIVGKKKVPQESNLVSPTRLRPLVGVDIRFVASGCGECLVIVWHWMLKDVVTPGGAMIRDNLGMEIKFSVIGPR